MKRSECLELLLVKLQERPNGMSKGLCYLCQYLPAEDYEPTRRYLSDHTPLTFHRIFVWDYYWWPKYKSAPRIKWLNSILKN